MKDFSEHVIQQHQPIKQALDRLNTLPNKNNLTLFVVNEQEQLVGTVTDGDIRRGILRNLSVSDRVEEFMFRDFHFLRKNQIEIDSHCRIENSGINLLPILDEDNRIIRIIDLTEKRCVLPVDALVMAGGRGERLRPLTDDVPKSLLKVGGKPIIEYEVDRLAYFGVHNIYISVNYLAEQLIEQVGDGTDEGLNIQYLKEKQPLGTIGALSLIKEFEYDTILVMNSDLLTNIDLEEFYKAYRVAEADLAIATIPYQVTIPYGVLDVRGSDVVAFAEKPTLTHYCNAGIYLISKELVKLIPEGEFYNATDLISEAIARGCKVSSFPLLDYWIDIGKVEDYQRAQQEVRYLKM